jgi:hypothetical protein
MTTDDDLQEAFSRRLHGLVAHPPAGRNLLPGIRKAAGRRRARVAAVSSGLGVTGVVVAGAVTSASLQRSPAAQRVEAAAPSPSTSAATTPATVPSQAASKQLPPTDKVPTTSPLPPHVVVAGLGDDAAALRAAPYYYQRTMYEDRGQWVYRSIWQSRTGAGRLEQPDPVSGTVTSMDLGPADFTGEGGQLLTWADFSSTPSAGQMHQWLFGATGTRLAFKDVHDLLAETPSTKAFRLAALTAIEQIPGVTVTASVKDAIGRTGEQVALGSTRYIIDPADGRLLQEDLLSDSCSSGVGYRSVLLEAGAVGADNQVLAEQPVHPTGAPAGCADGAGAGGNPAGPTPTTAPGP